MRSYIANVLVASLLLAACAREPGQNNKICLKPPTQASGEWGVCLHSMAYKLARSPDPATVVAKASVAGCAERIAEQINKAKVADRQALAEAIDGSAEGIALFYVVQARAGKCDVP